MSRKLRLQHTLVFQSSFPLFLRRIVLIFMTVPGIYFGILACTIFSGILLVIILILDALLSILLVLFSLDGIEGKVIVDAEGIEWRSPLKKTRLLWNEGLSFQVREKYSRGGTIRVYDVISPTATISFGENLRNHLYLRSIINAGINGVADRNSEVALPPMPLDIDHNTQTVNSLLFGAIMAFFGAVIVGILLYEDVRVIYFVPTVQIKDVAKYADNYKEIRVKGKLHLEPPVVARDDKHTYGYQFLQLSGSTDADVSLSTPGDITIVNGAEKLTIRVPDLPISNFGAPLQTKFERNWQKSKIGQLTTPGVDEHLQKYEDLLPNKNLQISVWNIEQDQPIEVLGLIKTEKNSLFLQPNKYAINWMSPSPNKKLENDFLIKAILMAAALAFGIYMLIAAYLKLKKAEFPNSV